MSGKKGMKQTKKKKPLTQEQKDKIRQTMKEKWKDKETEYCFGKSEW